ncbi:hypothetical protein [Fundidesulfovibrio terrae]|uniref:hypothetical protein n=1 Tax=Fundidesulfovibrio terrae TaxID=2922866 RepID=UPI001FB00822|nr:hypothetical protein [Fundidesulfovibrio terrae]
MSQSLTGVSQPAALTARTIWDGLAVDLPPSWEPARLGLGYARFEDASGPRLTLRWQRVKRPAAPHKVLKRLSRRKQLGPSDKPRGAVAAMLSALPPECGALPCADVSGQGADAVLFVLPGAQTAVLAAPHAKPDEKATPWVRAAASLAPADPGSFSLFDVSGEAPPGFSLAAFSVQLGHFHFRYRLGSETLDYYRFAPAEVILRRKALEDWAGNVFVQTLGKAPRFASGEFDGFPAARHESGTPGGLARSLRSLAARMFAGARFTRALAWRPDAHKILAAVAFHRGGLSGDNFEEVCRRYVLRTP